MNDGNSNVRFWLSEAGAFNLRVFSKDSDFYRKTLLTNGNATLNVPTGTYQATVEPLGQKYQSVPVTIDIGAETTQVELPSSLQQPSRSKHDHYKIPIRKQLLRRSESPSQNDGESTFTHAQSIWDSLREDLDSEESNRHFSVGISRDTRVQKIGGWRPATGLAVESIIDDEGALTLTFYTEAIGPEHRLRATFALEGKAAVRVPIPLYKGGVRISFAPTIAMKGLDGVVSITPVEPAIAALTGLMDQLTDTEADEILRWNGIDHPTVIKMFAEKRNDPWTATAAAVLLTRLRRLDDMASWAYRLADIAPYIADSPVVAAWACAATLEADKEQHERKILDFLIEARKRGAPTYYVSQTLAMDLLSVMATSATATDTRLTAKKEHGIWSRRGRRRLDVGSYLVWEQLGKGLRKGRLPSNGYESIAHGELTRNGFTL